MYLVDTSVWIHALRPTGSPDVQARLKPLIETGHAAVTEWILLELMTGLPKHQTPTILFDWFAPVTRLHFDATWWQKAYEYAARLRKSGVSPSAADCFIATIALEHRVVLLHCDRDFEAMAPILKLETLDWTRHTTPVR